MSGTLRATFGAIIGWATCLGCAPLSEWGAARSAARPSAPLSTTAALPPLASSPPADLAPPGAASVPPTASNVAAPPLAVAAAKPSAGPDLATVMHELQQIGVVDPEAQRAFMDDLKRSDPNLWPLMVNQFKATLAYRRRAEAPTVSVTTSPPSHAAPSATPDVAAATNSAAPIATPPAGEPQGAPQSPAASRVEPDPAAVGESPRELPDWWSSSAHGSTTPTPSTAASPRSTSAGSPSPGDPAAALAEAIRLLEEETRQAPATTADIAKHVRLRMLYLAAGRREDALQPIAGVEPAQQDYWASQLYALATLTDVSRNPDLARRASESRKHLDDAAAKLGEIALLGVRNIAFASEVSSYGVFHRFEKDEFVAGQKVLLYAEVENFKCESTPKGHHVALRSSYQILDSRKQRVAEFRYPVTEEHCGNPRRDFFIRYFVSLPERIDPGKYTLQLTIEDTLGQKLGQSSLEFSIKGK